LEGSLKRAHAGQGLRLGAGQGWAGEKKDQSGHPAVRGNEQAWREHYNQRERFSGWNGVEGLYSLIGLSGFLGFAFIDRIEGMVRMEAVGLLCSRNAHKI